MEREWATRADDVLWRRSKLGLHLDAAGRAAIERWMEAASVPESLAARPVSTA